MKQSGNVASISSKSDNNHSSSAFIIKKAKVTLQQIQIDSHWKKKDIPKENSTWNHSIMFQLLQSLVYFRPLLLWYISVTKNKLQTFMYQKPSKLQPRNSKVLLENTSFWNWMKPIYIIHSVCLEEGLVQRCHVRVYMLGLKGRPEV